MGNRRESVRVSSGEVWGIKDLICVNNIEMFVLGTPVLKHLFGSELQSQYYYFMAKLL